MDTVVPAGRAVQTVSAELETQALLNKARAIGSVRVIATLNVAAGDPGTLSEAEMAAYTGELRKVQEAVVDRVLGGDRSGVTAFDITPALALSVTPGQLEMLLADPAVLRIQEDGLAGPSGTQGDAVSAPGQ